MLKDLLLKNNLSLYECSKSCNIPYTTLSELVRGKTPLLKCSTEIVYKLSKLLKISMEELITLSEVERVDLEVYKSNVCHELKQIGDLDFIINTLKGDYITYYWNKKWYFETFYLLATIDYLCRLNNLPLCNKYDKIRLNKMPNIVYPKDIILADKLNQDLNIKENAIKNAIPEFLRFNILERSIRDVQ